MKIARKEDIYRIDKLCAEKYGMPTAQLMENAGAAVLRAIQQTIPDFRAIKYLVICGKGNNGGDGAVVARMLHEEGAEVYVLLAEEIEKSPKDAKDNFEKLDSLNTTAFFIGQESLPALEKLIYSVDCVIDALYGIGFHGEMDQKIAEVVNIVNRSRKIIIAIDIPSGIYADGGTSRIPVKADITVTLGLPKIGMLDYPGFAYNGKIVVDPISIPPELLDNPSFANWLTPDELKKRYRPRNPDSHKGNYGHLLIIGGWSYSHDQSGVSMTGAAILSSLSALRAGSGLVTIAAPSSSILAFQTAVPEAITISLDADDPADSVRHIQSYIQKRGIKNVLIGNGLGTGDIQTTIVEAVLNSNEIEHLVIDADALNILAGNKKLLSKLRSGGKKIIITPHIGEASRLLDMKTGAVKLDKIKSATELSKMTGGTVILKDAVSIVSSPEGEIWLNTTGSPALAKGGSGDVLAGLIAGLYTSGYDSLASALMGCYLLGKAAEIYEQRFSSESAFAREIIGILPEAWKEL